MHKFFLANYLQGSVVTDLQLAGGSSRIRSPDYVGFQISIICTYIIHVRDMWTPAKLHVMPHL
jgi:hypothetical protein